MLADNGKISYNRALGHCGVTMLCFLLGGINIKQRRMTKKQALFILSACVKKYENNLMGKTILFVCTDKRKQVSVLEVTFERSNFLHLTGIKPTAGISAKDFYERCLDSRLKESDFAFAEDGTTFMKLEMLPFLVEEDLSVKMVGEYSASNIKLYTTKLAGNVKGCIGFVKKRAGKN